MARVECKTIHTVNGNDISKMSDDALIGFIKEAKKEIADLEAVGIESTAIAQKIAKINETIDFMVAKLDGVEEAADAE